MIKKGGLTIRLSAALALWLFAALLLAGTAMGEVSREGLVGEWLFDGDAKDTSVNGNDGTVYGATFVEGKFGKALSFDGVDDYVDFKSAATDYMSVSLWYKTRDKINNYPSFLETGHSDCDGGGGCKFSSYGQIVNVATRPDYGKLFWSFEKASGRWGDWSDLTSVSRPSYDEWHNLVVTYGQTKAQMYIDGVLDVEATTDGSRLNIPGERSNIGRAAGGGEYSFNGLIDDVRIYNRALSADEIKELYEGKQTASTALTLIKTASPYSIKQGQTTTITLTIENTGTTDITNIEVMDSIHRNFDLISGDFPNPRKFDIIGKGESREIQYMIKAKDGGTFNLDPATGIYTDKDGNIQEAKSEPFSVKVITSFEPTPAKTSAPASTPEPTTNPVKTASVSLYGEKTDVVLGEDILLKLSAVNLITKPMMHVQVIIIPPSGMSVTSSEFSKIAAGQFTANYELPPGDGRDIEVSIKSNQIGDFNVNGRIIYYFGDEKVNAEDHNLNLPIKVRREAGQTVANPTPIPTASGFAGEVAIIGVLFVALFIRWRKI